MSIAYCESLARKAKYKYFALQNGNECFGSKVAPTYAKKPDTECSKPCPGVSNKGTYTAPPLLWKGNSDYRFKAPGPS
jgi:hypothetical protein